MPIALISTNPMAVVTTYAVGPVDIDIPEEGQFKSVDAGWQSPDGLYRIVTYASFVPPPGKVISGGVIYTVDAQGNVTEVYGVADLPSPAVIPPATFRGLFTAEERLSIATISMTDPQVRIWIDDCLFLGVVDLTSAEVTEGFEYLVAHNIMTQARADEILAFRVAAV